MCRRLGQDDLPQFFRCGRGGRESGATQRETPLALPWQFDGGASLAALVSQVLA